MSDSTTNDPRDDYQVGAYYFPNYHLDPRNEAVHGPGWTEWELVKLARPRFEGHRQPRVPLWGYEDEADPEVMARKVAAAADHGVDYWIFDWYWYDDGPFLSGCLEEGYLGAAVAAGPAASARVRFCCMWANHDWVDIHPAKLHEMAASVRLLYPGRVTPATLDAIADVVIQRYFSHPSYWRIDGCPYFSVYELSKLLESCGGVEATAAALQTFRRKVRVAGYPDVHLNAVVWSVRVLPGETAVESPNALLHALGFDSITSYVWIHHGGLEQFPSTDYDTVRDRYLAYWTEAERAFDLPYFPNVTVGWDPSPRTVQSDAYLNAGYPFTPVIVNNTPERFRVALAQVKERMAFSPAQPKVLTLNAWNEWTEGSYLEPDTHDGYAYLEAIREVFGR